MINKIDLKGRRIEYSLEYKNVKNINLRIRADRTLFVSANLYIPVNEIETFIYSKADYILKALDRYEEIARYAPKPKEYIDGESFRILGHDMRLRVVEGNRNGADTDEAYILLMVKNKEDSELKKKVMDKWIMEQCKKVIPQICSEVYMKFQKYGVKFPEIRIRNMVSRWGSCQPKRCLLTFNTRLIEAPVNCVEYVVTHEFTHFLQPNHSRNFYRQLSMFMPDWEERKKVLEKNSYFVE